CGLRVNTQLPFVKDNRYNPCRKHSKLGVPLDKLASISNNGNTTLRGLKGILFHTNCESTSFNHLLKTVKHLDAHIPRLLKQIEWVNMGGGYMFDESRSLDKFTEAVTFLKDKYNVEVFIEPGKGIVGKAGHLVSSVVDIFDSDGKNIAVLDTTVNHMPEVFEYQFKPDIMQESENGKYKYILAGSTCLAGDLFGEYSFDEPLELGSRIVFENMGAYTLVKANMFNGINLPSIYVYTKDGKLELVKKFGYEDFLSRCGVKNNVPA
ncbi:MAG: 2Fe-2S ferredoxin, partial [Nitrospirae bacterium]|nr:2Fe-2S ferredoxin [Nitrospirota bacterium]